MTRRVFLDPDGKGHDWLYVLVRADTGVVYESAGRPPAPLVLDDTKPAHEAWLHVHTPDGPGALV